MPFRVASEDSVEYAELKIWLNSSAVEAAALRDWDYLSELTFSAEVSVDIAAFLTATGLSSVVDVGSVLQIDCLATGARWVDIAPVDARSGRALNRLVLPPGQAAQKLELRQMVVLLADQGAGNSAAAASLRGSRLHEGANRTLTLEGESNVFPTEAFDFAAADLPRHALWMLQFEPHDLDGDLLAHVRLLVNASHPCAAGLLAKDSQMTTAVMHDILKEMLLRVAAMTTPDAVDFDRDRSESVGATLDRQCRFLLGLNLGEVVEKIRSDRAVLLARLQSEMRFMEVEEA